MATMITSECINCGACEPECPNNAISQGEDIYVIDPLLCTECVGFHNFEACAAVCPVDCCVTDPNNIEAEDALIARARNIHPVVEFGEVFESRFRKGAEKPKTPTAKETPQEGKAIPEPRPTTPKTAPVTAPEPAVAAQPTLTSDGEEPLPASITLPDMEDWEIPVTCFKCGETYTATAKRFRIGNVLFCPHCYQSTVVKDNLNFRIRTALSEFYRSWEEAQEEFQAKRERDLREFRERRERELADFEAAQQRALQKVKEQLKAISQSYDAPGRPVKKRALLKWG
jgi:Pyruvate/2-oxoacid:ferredoxin oxidoreductase delta subunit